ncbi:MAG: hypothetical protein M1812_002503 [Candelaria pacifica]|nr:MAG: hypothetical protein M1812_002503 [Candelaria pacifica]
MQFNNRSILLAAAALVFAQSAVTAPSQELAERAASTGYTGPGVYTINNVATGTRVSLYRSGVNDGTPIVGSHNDTDSHQQWRIDEPTSLGGAFKSMTNVATGKLIAAQATLPPPNSVNTLTAQSVPSSYNNQNLYKVWLITAPLGDGSYE